MARGNYPEDNIGLLVALTFWGFLLAVCIGAAGHFVG